MGQYLLFSFTAAANPTLVAATTILLLSEKPKRLMLGYLLGAYTMSITLGMVIVFSLKNSSEVNSAKSTWNPYTDLAVGAVFLIICFVLATGRDAPAAERRKAKKAAKPEKGPPRWKRALDNGSPRTTFAVGALLTLPGASYLAALGQIVEGGYGTTQSALMVVLTNLIMLMLLEVPLLGYIFKPDWTPSAVERAKAWVGRHARRAVVILTGTLGGLLVLRGIITLIAS